MKSRGPGPYGAEFSTNLARSLRFHVEGFVLGKSAREKDVDDVSGLPVACRGLGTCQRADQTKVVHPQAHETYGTGLQDRSAGGMIMRKVGHARGGDSVLSGVDGEV